MDKKNLFTYLTIAGLSIAFIIVSALLIFSGGKNARLLRKKLKLGAMIISLTAVISTSYVACCYVPPQPMINLDLTYIHTDTIFFNRSFTDKIYGVQHNIDKYHEYYITNYEIPATQTGYFEPVDGLLDTDYEEIELFINPKLPEAVYLFETQELYMEYDYVGCDYLYLVITSEKEIFFIDYYGEEKNFSINLAIESNLDVNIALSESQQYSYKIINQYNEEIQAQNFGIENCNPYLDTSYMKKGSINFINNIESGSYKLKIYNVPASDQDNNSPISEYDMEVK